jgi:nitrogen regulatory protein PII
MKAVFIIFNQGISEEIAETLDDLGIRGFTQWQEVNGRGSTSGEPRLGTHTWPALNNALITVVEEEKALQLLDRLKQLDGEFPEQGLRAFMLPVEKAV